MERSRVLLIFSLFFVILPPPSASQGFRMDLTHVDSKGNFTKFERIQRATRRSHHRLERLTGLQATTSKLAASTNNVRSSVHAGNGEFLMDLSIGTPSVPFSAIVDTGSDLIWTQCKPCVECFVQPTPIFDPKNSTTFSVLSCSADLCEALPISKCNKDSTCEYLYTYGDSSSTQGVLGSETFTFGSASIPRIGFGCGDTNQGGGFPQGSGLVGLGRGPLSLVSQLKAEKFSYCLTALDGTSKSPLMLGSMAELNATSAANAIQSTPLVQNAYQPSLYYLTLKGITVGKIPLNIPSTAFALQDDGTGGLIIDSGTSITYLDVSAYRLLKAAFVSQVKMDVADGSDIGLDLCFSTPSGSKSVEVPKLIFHFDGADLDLPGENYMILDSDTGLLCLTVMGSSGMSIFGNFQQQNMHVLYDVKKETLSFTPAKCDQL